MIMIKKVIVLSLLLSLIACTGKNTKEYASVDEMLKDAASQVEYVKVDELKTIIDTHKPIYLIDCREQIEFDSACIKNAINIPRGTLENTVSEKLPKHRQTVIIYCNNGQRSTLAATVLPRLKYSDVKVLEGGFDALKSNAPQLIELNPIRGNSATKAPAKPAGGCGG
jgi:rhodanese-related sulfurtransferase